MNKHPIHLIKKDRTYTTQELAETLKVDKGTVLRWHKAGLPALPDVFPLLFKGDEVKMYLIQQRRTQKHPMQPNEFFCMHCHIPTLSVPGCVQIIKGRHMGKFQQYRIIGKCETCNTRIIRLVTNKTPEVLEAMKLYQAENQNLTQEDSLCQ